MALIATFGADLDRFEAALNKSTAHLQTFDRAVKTASRDFTRSVESFSGEKIAAETHRMAKAVQDLGGVSKLTETELRRVAATVQEFTAKMRAVGQDVPPHIAKLNDELKRVAPASESASIGFGKLVGSFVTAQAIVGAARSAFHAYIGLLTSSVESFARAESAQVKLAAAVRAQGNATPEVIQQYNQLATTFQRTTAYADDLLMEMQGLLVQVGNVMPHEMQGALKAATDLASGLGIDLRTATMLVGKAFEGETGTLKRYGIVIDETKLKTQGATAVLTAIQQKFGGQAQAEVNTYAGQVKQLANAWDDLKERVGEFAVRNNEVQALMAGLSRVLQDMTRESGEATTGVGKLWQAWERYIEIGRTLTPGLVAWNKLLNEQAAAAERARQAAAIPEPTLNVPSALPDISGQGMEVFNKQVEDHKKALEAAKIAAENFRQVQEGLFSRDVIARADVLSRALGSTANVTKLTTDKKRELHTAVEAAITAYTALGREAPAKLRDILALTTDLVTVTRAFSASTSGAWAPFTAGVKDAGQELQNIAKGLEGNGNLISRSLHEAALSAKAADDAFMEWARTNGVLITSIEDTREGVNRAKTATEDWTDQLGDLSQALSFMAQVGGDSFGGVVQWLATLVSAAHVANKASDTMRAGWDSLGKEGVEVSESLAQIATGAITAAAALLQATGSGSTFQRTLGGIAAGAQAGSAFGPWGAAIGAAAGALTGFLRGIFGVSDAIKKARAEVDKFQADLQKTLTATQLNEAGGRSWAATLIAVRDAFVKTGRSAAEAEKLVAQLLNTDRPDAARRAMEKINRVMEEQKRIFDEAKDAAGDLFDEIRDLAGDAGGIPDFLRPHIDQMEQLGLLTKEQAAELRKLGDAGATNWKKVTDAAEKYGVRIESLGQPFNAQRINADAAGIINAFNTIVDAGGDVGGVLFDMQDEISKVVNDAKKFGTTIPENMQPWIDELLRAGLLVDEQGDKLTDLGGVRYGDRIKTEAEKSREAFEKIVAKIEELIDKITGPLRDALDDTFRDRTIKVGVTYEGELPARDLNFDRPRLQALRAPSSALGGRVSAALMRSGGEAVHNTYTVPVILNGREITQVVIDQLGTRLAVLGGRR